MMQATNIMKELTKDVTAKSCRVCNAKCSESLSVNEMMFGTRNEYKYWVCGGCGTVQIDQLETDENKLYPEHYYSFSIGEGITAKLKKWLVGAKVKLELEEGRLSLFSAVIKRLGMSQLAARSLKGVIQKQSRILDVGCGSGELLGGLYYCGYKNLTGIDPYISHSIYKPFPIERIDIAEYKSDEKFDVIMLHHSFEHMASPLDVLVQVRELLSSQGLCIIRIPVGDCRALEEYQQYWFQLDAPRHVFLHTTEGMNLLCDKAGLKVEQVVDDSGESSVIFSEQYKRGVSLFDECSFLATFWKRINPFRKTLFTSGELSHFRKKANEWKAQGQGDQKIFYIHRSSSQL